MRFLARLLVVFGGFALLSFLIQLVSNPPQTPSQRQKPLQQSQYDRRQHVCVDGSGSPEYANLCDYTCSRGYCPANVCDCTAEGDIIPLATTNQTFCPAPNVDASYVGLCAFSCAQGHCPPEYCQVQETSTRCNFNTSNESPADRLARLKGAFKGIFWNTTMAPEEEGGCTVEQLNILEEATRVALAMVETNADGRPIMNDKALLEYFVTDVATNFQWTTTYVKGDFKIEENMKEVERFIRDGPKSGSTSPNHLIEYVCKDLDDPGHCNKTKSSSPDKMAYIRHRPRDKITFCPLFFEQKFINSVLAVPKRTPSDRGPTMISYEHTLIHEWMHSDQGLKFGQKIVHWDKDDEWKMVYGSSRCHDFAWKNMMESKKPNNWTVVNADNYAWLYSTRLFSQRWGWESLDWTTSELDNTPPALG